MFTSTHQGEGVGKRHFAHSMDTLNSPLRRKRVHIWPFAPQLIIIEPQFLKQLSVSSRGARGRVCEPHDTFRPWLLTSIPSTCPGAESQIEMEHDYLKEHSQINVSAVMHVSEEITWSRTACPHEVSFSRTAYVNRQCVALRKCSWESCQSPAHADRVSDSPAHHSHPTDSVLSGSHYK